METSVKSQAELNIGIKSLHRGKVAKSLNELLADEHVLYIKTRNAHWNVEGHDFHAMHLFFETQYTELAQCIDDIAERIRSLGHYAVGTMKEYIKISHLTEQSSERNDSQGFIRELLEDHESIIVFLREHIKRFDEEWHDAGTSDFITGLMEKHEKMAWMLRAHLV